MAEPKLTFGSKVANAEAFFKEVDALVKLHKLPYLEAAILYCEKNGIDTDVAAAMITNNAKFKSIIQSEGESLNFLPRSARLPV